MQVAESPTEKLISTPKKPPFVKEASILNLHLKEANLRKRNKKIIRCRLCRRSLFLKHIFNACLPPLPKGNVCPQTIMTVVRTHRAVTIIAVAIYLFKYCANNLKILFFKMCSRHAASREESLKSGITYGWLVSEWQLRTM